MCRFPLPFAVRYLQPVKIIFFRSYSLNSESLLAPYSHKIVVSFQKKWTDLVEVSADLVSLKIIFDYIDTSAIHIT